MQCTKDALGKKRVSLEEPWPITSPHTPLFCVVNMMVAKVVTLSVASL